MKKHFFLGALTGTLLATAAVFSFSQWWAQTSWPYSTHFVQVDIEKPTGRTICEVYTAMGAARRMLPNGTAAADGHIRNCVLQVTANKLPDGSLEVLNRPRNPLEVAAWKSLHRFGTLQQAHINGLCTDNEYYVLRGTKQGVSPKCQLLLDTEGAVKLP